MRPKTILDVKNYNFDDQSATILKTPEPFKAGDTIRVVCSFKPTLRQKLPKLQKLPPRYITWGEGSSEKMIIVVISTTKQQALLFLDQSNHQQLQAKGA